VGAIAENVTVTGSSPLIETATVSVGQVMAEKTVQEIPLNGRHFVDLGPLMPGGRRSEEHTSELQSRVDLVCRLLLEKKNLSTTNETLQRCICEYYGYIYETEEDDTDDGIPARTAFQDTTDHCFYSLRVAR